jgi:hypothetical protein
VVEDEWKSEVFRLFEDVVRSLGTLRLVLDICRRLLEENFEVYRLLNVLSCVWTCFRAR